MPLTPEVLLSVFESIGDSLVVLGATGEIRAVNRATSQLLGWRPAELVGEPFGFLLASDDAVRAAEYVRLWRRDSGLVIDADYVGNDGGRLPLALRGTAIRDQDGGVTGIVVLGRDLRTARESIVELEQANQELRRAQAALARNERVATLGVVAASIAHDLNQPLNAIKLAAQTRLRDLAEVRTDLEEIVALVGSMAGIISEARAFARRGSEAPLGEVDVNREIRRAVYVLQSDLRVAAIELHERLGPDCVVRARAFKLQQVLVNLLQNSCDALSEREGSRSVWVDSSLNAEGQVVVTVRDNAGGIPEEARARVFAPFFSTKPDGIGLGLSICKQIVDELAGSLELNVEEGVGTTFSLHLPAANPQ